MARARVPFARDGMKLPVYIIPTPDEMVRLHAAGQPIPPELVWAEIDTGANPTAVALPVVVRLGLARTREDVSRTAAGSVGVNVYEVTLGLPAMFGLPAATVIVDKLEVTALTHEIPGIDVLLGLDVLLNCQLHVDGPGRVFTLDF